MLESYADPEDALELFMYSDYPFNMMFVEDGNNDPFVATASNAEDVIERVLENTPEDRVPNWVVSTTRA